MASRGLRISCWIVGIRFALYLQPVITSPVSDFSGGISFANALRDRKT